MKAAVNDRVELLEEVPADFSNSVLPSGAHGVVIEAYDDPVEGYAVDVALLDNTAGGLRYENVILHPHQFRVLKSEGTA